jgi:ribosomal protein L3 glutamine methyltransferase
VSSPDAGTDLGLAAARRGHASPWTVRDLIRLGESAFNRAGVSCRHSQGTPMREARFLTYWGLDLRHFDDAHLDVRPTVPEAARVLDLFEARIATRKPAAHITGEAFLEGHWFVVTDDVFVPRSPLVGHLATVAGDLVTATPRTGPLRILDLGCGSGALGIIVALAVPDAQVDLADVDPAAIAVARRNVERYGLGARVHAIESDLVAACPGPYDLVVSNPPHVPTAKVLDAPPEVRAEPTVAWDGGPDGLDVVRRVLGLVPAVLAPTGVLLIDVGAVGRRVLPIERADVPFTWLGPPDGTAAGVAVVPGQWDPAPAGG